MCKSVDRPFEKRSGNFITCYIKSPQLQRKGFYYSLPVRVSSSAASFVWRNGRPSCMYVCSSSRFSQLTRPLQPDKNTALCCNFSASNQSVTRANYSCVSSVGSMSDIHLHRINLHHIIYYGARVSQAAAKVHPACAADDPAGAFVLGCSLFSPSTSQ